MLKKPLSRKPKGISPSRVIKVPEFSGRLSPRALYVYLPPGYNDQPDRRYPVLYMHDGQNAFKAYEVDSYAGAWDADLTADLLIAAGEMQPAIIVGVANGGKRRMAEYLPPYVTIRPKARRRGAHPAPIQGRADRTAEYYLEDVAGYINDEYRVLSGREHTATCGSSMGGVFSTYLAFEHPEFARNHALLSPSYWTMYNQEGGLEVIDALKSLEAVPDLRLWLDSGTYDREDVGNDDRHNTTLFREALIEAGFVEGQNLRYFLDEGAVHHESSWSARLPEVFRFLFPPVGVE